MLTVHLRINDAATARPTPVRLRLSTADGVEYAPFGRVVEFAIGKAEDVGGHVLVGRERYWYINGACEVQLPAGVPVRVQATKGPEYEPLDQTVTLGAGQISVRFAVKRWSNLRDEGWYAGDIRAHFLSPHSAMLEAAAEDLAVVNLLACEQRLPSPDGTAYLTVPNMTAFSGQVPALQTEAALVAVNTFNVHPVLGKVGLLHSHRAVFPLAFGGPEASDDWSVCDWCDQCHRKKGLTVWAEPFTAVSGEALIALILGKIDAIEYDGRPRPQPMLPQYYRLLNAGFVVPLVGGSAKESNRVPLGCPRTYAHLPAGEPFTYTNWINAVRAGQCFVTNGPLLRFAVDGARLTASAESISPFDRLELVADGTVIASVAATSANGRWSASLSHEHEATESSWVAARCLGDAGSMLNPDHSAFAHSAPVFGQSPRRQRTAPVVLRHSIEQTREWIESHGRFENPKCKQHLLDLCAAALAKLADEAAP